MSMKPTATETFSEYFDRQGLRHFKARELTWYFGKVRKGVSNSEPPRELWPNIIPTMRVLDELRGHFGESVTINSTYRAIPYNRALKSPDTSLHVAFNAVDFTVRNRTPAQVFAVLDGWRKAKKWVGGLGRYATFVHIDTRGRNATWG